MVITISRFVTISPPLEGERTRERSLTRRLLMHRWTAAALAVFVLLNLPESCVAQRALVARIKKVTEVPIWQRLPLEQKESRKVLQDLQSTDQKTMQAAFEKLKMNS